MGEEKPAAGINASSSGKCQQIDLSGIAAGASVVSVLTTHPCVSRCLRVNGSAKIGEVT